MVGSADAQAPLTLEAKIPLGEVNGRIDHLAIDLGRHRLFVAELGNDSVGVVDLDQRKIIHVIAGLKAPQGIAHEASTDTLYVANGGDGTVRMFQAADFVSLGRIDLGDDADNIRVDAATKQLFIGYASGALAVIDPLNRNKIADIGLRAHPESFQLDKGTPRIFINVPDKQTISVVDRNARREIAAWPTGNGTHFAMALDHESKRLLVSFRDPPKVGVFDIESGSPVTSVETCGDIDDMFVDAKRRRLYVSCGEGFCGRSGQRQQRVRRALRASPRFRVHGPHCLSRKSTGSLLRRVPPRTSRPPFGCFVRLLEHQGRPKCSQNN